MDALSGTTPSRDPDGADTGSIDPPPTHVAVLDRGGVIVSVDNRWAAAAQAGLPPLGAIGSVGDRYDEVCESSARHAPDGRDHLRRLAGSVRDVLAGGPEIDFGYAATGRSYIARVVPVRGAGEDNTLVVLADTTDHPAGATVRELRRRFDTMAKALDVGVMLQDVEGRAIAWNGSAERLLGLTGDQLSGRDAIDPRWVLLHEDGWPLPRDERPARIALRTRRPCREAVVGIKQPEGRVTWISANAHPLFEDGEERPYAVALSLTDVTLARAAEASERRQSDRFRSLIEYSSDVISILDAGGRLVYQSPSVEHVGGHAHGEPDQDAQLARIHPDDLENTLDAVQRLQGRPGESTFFEYRIRARDGSWRIHESVATNRLHDPSVVGIVVTTRDITERREAEAALRATTSRLENLVQNLHAGVLVEDDDRRVAVVNSDFCTIFGVEEPPGALLGRTWGQAFGAPAGIVGGASKFVARRDELAAGREPVHGEEVAFTDGRTFECDYIPVASGHLWIIRDITSRKREELAAARVRDEAIRASRLKSEFLATMSHEIRTPMNGVVGTIELLLDTDLAPHQRELAGLVRDSAFGLLSIVDDALDLSRIEAEKLEPREVGFELAAVAESVADVVMSAARRKGLGLSVYVDPRISAPLRGDPQWVRQVLVNLAGNAVKFTDAGEVRIRADLQARTPRSTTVRFTVADTGIGIPEDQRERLFEPFVQLDASATRRHGGTGLGLAICRRLVRLMSGELEVQSAPGKGSEFSFSLALGTAGEGAAERPSGDAQGLHVLIAEPRDEVARVAAEYLGAWGIHAERATTPDAALELATAAARAGRRFDVAIVGTETRQAAAEVAHSLRGAPGSEMTALVLLKDMGAPAAGPGSPFAAELTRPLKRSDLYEAVVGAAHPSAVRAAGADGGVEARREPLPHGLRVLVAEDNEVNQELFVRQLAKLGAVGVPVSSGGAAIAAVTARRYDAILMDVRMPDVDGIRATRAIRALAGDHGTVPIIAVTASGTPDEREVCMTAGMDAFLTKPITSHALEHALRSTLGMPGEDAPPRAPAIDTGAVERLAEDIGDRAELRRIAGIYLEQMAPGGRAVAAAVAAGDSEALARAAHRLSSASATFGALGVAELCQRLQALGEAGRARAAVDLVGALEAERERAAAELRRMLEITDGDLGPIPD